MKTAAQNPKTLLPLSPAVFHVLLALSDGEQHGYAIMREVAGSTGGTLKMGPGTLYGTIKRMLESKLIEESEERPDPEKDDERRRYYRLTPFGMTTAKLEASRLETLVRAARGKKLLGLKGANQ
ncbi:MAG: PadR family transcriptional regulator [Verrucomicrobiales bacterium]|nr:PadR family transcriptional regulator [Verrucomicrobiales bacterium]